MNSRIRLGFTHDLREVSPKGILLFSLFFQLQDLFTWTTCRCTADSIFVSSTHAHLYTQREVRLSVLCRIATQNTRQWNWRKEKKFGDGAKLSKSGPRGRRTSQETSVATCSETTFAECLAADYCWLSREGNPKVNSAVLDSRFICPTVT